MCSDAPDYSGVASASAESARIGAELGNRQIDLAERAYAQVLPYATRAADAQIDAMNAGTRQGEDYYNYMMDTFRPVERSLVADVENFNTGAERERLAGAAAADVSRSMGLAREAEGRRLSSMGVNPNSGRFASLGQQQGLQEAALRSDAMTGARTAADNTGYARRLDVVGMGRGLPGASTGAYGLATSAGSSAINSMQQPSNTLMTGTNAGAGTIMAGRQQQLSGLTNVMNTQAADQDDFLQGIAGLGMAAGRMGLGF